MMVPLSMGERYVIEQGLAKLDFTFAREVAEKLEGTHCKWCDGNGHAPYVGGDDDDARCGKCHGHGFETRKPAGL